MFVVHGTRKLLDRLKAPSASATEPSTTTMGDWYATTLPWRPQVALFVNERTLLPVLLPLAPAATLISRFPSVLEEMLDTYGLDAAFIEHEISEMDQHRLAPTSNRSLVGSMNEFATLAGHYRSSKGADDLLGISRWLSEVPCGPLDKRHGSPDRELRALAGHDPADDAEARRWAADVRRHATTAALADDSALVRQRLEAEAHKPRRSAALPELDVARIRRFCEERVPAHLRDEVRVEAEVRGRSITIRDCRPPWHPELAHWSRVPVAQLRHADDHQWTLYWADRNGRWHLYDLLAPGTAQELLHEIAADPTCIFWG